MTNTTPGFHHEWTHNNRIVVFTIAAVNWTSIQAYGEVSHDIISNWNAEQPYLSLRVLEPEVTVTPRLHATDIELNHLCFQRKLTGRSAIVAQNPYALQIYRRLTSANGRHPYVVQKAFTNQADAVQWLEQLC